MGDPTGGIVHPQDMGGAGVMAPQMARPTPGAPQFGPQIPSMLLNPAEAKIAPEAVSPPLTGSMVQGDGTNSSSPR